MKCTRSLIRAPGGKSRISADGGNQPGWARNGRELFYCNGDATMSVKIDTTPSLSPGRPNLLFRNVAQRAYDVMPDGRFLVVEELPSRFQPITVALNWLQELQHRSSPGAG